MLLWYHPLIKKHEPQNLLVWINILLRQIDGHHPSHLGRSLWLVGLSIFVRIWGQWTREKNIGLFAYWIDQVNKFNRLLLMVGICERFLLTICWRWLSQVKENASGKKASIMEVKRAINQIIPQYWPSIYIYKNIKKCL